MYFTTLLRDKFGISAFLLVVLYFVFLIRGDMVQNSRLNYENKMTMNILNSEIAKNAELKNDMRLLNKDSYIELVAREKLGLIRKGERPYKVIVK